MKITAKTFTYGGKDYSVACENHFLVAYKEIGGQSCVIVDHDGDVLFEIAGVLAVFTDGSRPPLKDFRHICTSTSAATAKDVYFFVAGTTALIVIKPDDIIFGEQIFAFQISLQEGWEQTNIK